MKSRHVQDLQELPWRSLEWKSLIWRSLQLEEPGTRGAYSWRRWKLCSWGLDNQEGNNPQDRTICSRQQLAHRDRSQKANVFEHPVGGWTTEKEHALSVKKLFILNIESVANYIGQKSCCATAHKPSLLRRLQAQTLPR